MKPEAAVAIVCARTPCDSILLMRRSERADDSWSGHWSLPGGRCEADDADLLQTALRELEEECGIRLERTHRDHELSPLIARRVQGPFMLVAPFVFSVESQLPTVIDPREAVETLWLPRALLCDPGRHALHSVPGHPKEVLYPGLALNGIPLWGFTYRLLTDWLGLLPKNIHEPAGFNTARLVLDFLLSTGLTLKDEWRERIDRPNPVKIAHVRGTIPVEAILARFSLPGEGFPNVNMLEVRPDYIRLAGLAFEEYIIRAEAL